MLVYQRVDICLILDRAAPFVIARIAWPPLLRSLITLILAAVETPGAIDLVPTAALDKS